MSNKINIEESLNDYNKFLEKFDIETLSEEYSIEDIENSIGKIINNILMYNACIDITAVFEVGIELDIASLLFNRNENYPLLDIEETYIGLKKYGIQILYLNYYFRNASKIIASQKCGNLSVNSSFGGIQKMCHNGGFKYIDLTPDEKYSDLHKLCIYNKISEKEALDLYNKEVKRRETLKKIAKTIFEKDMLEIIGVLEEVVNNHSIKLEHEVVELKQWLKNEYDYDLENIKGQAWLLNSNKIILLKNNFFAIGNFLYCKEKDMFDYMDILYDALDYEDDIIITTKKGTETRTNINPYLRPQKRANIANKAIKGAFLGGTSGALIATLSAIENNKQLDIIESNHSLVSEYQVNYDLLEIELCCYFSKEYLDGLYLYKLSFDNKKYDENIEVFINDLCQLKSQENLVHGSLIALYFESNKNIVDFDENEFEKFILPIKQKRIEDYWNIHQEEKMILKNKLKKLQEEDEKINQQIIKLENENAPEITRLNNKKNQPLILEEKYNELKSKIDNLTQEKKSLGLFNFSAKKDLESKITLETKNFVRLQKSIEQQRNEINKEVDNEIIKLNAEITRLKEKLSANEKKQQEIIFELKKDR